MNNKDYKLNIDDKYVKLFQKNLGFGNPLEAKYWFIGNEEKLIEKDKNDYNDFHEIPLERIINNKLNCKKSDILKRNENNKFFTKKFFRYEYIDELEWGGYKTMHYIVGGNLRKAFVSEFYFLPSFSGKLLGEKYGTDEENRKSFYENNINLMISLEERIKFIFGLLPIIGGNEVYIYGKDNNVSEKIDLMKKIFNKEKEIFKKIDVYEGENYIGEKFVVEIYDFKGNKIYISQDINKI